MNERKLTHPIDYEELEKRILKGEAVDLHREIAGCLFEIPASLVDEQQRMAAKWATMEVVHFSSKWQSLFHLWLEKQSEAENRGEKDI